ncbi:septum formation protein [Legionella rubrilucens]|uniref:dTTP/UTP pyrophosphatase n=1 Tax=Legionella rubrilucens TaxID=458 RepID=A0A0W0XPN9_9GAMM|nr:Maf family protein [Legionella rubrilucens]KTD46619.1 septum formation protein [Legionella rubrilucens]
MHALNMILASASPRRRHLLEAHGFRARVMPADIEEIPQPNEAAKAYVTRLAKEKAEAVLSRIAIHEADLILAADTTVAYQNHILEKPRDANDAYTMLQRLSGKTHEVHTGYALVFLPAKRWIVDCVTTTITFHTLTEEQIHQYIDSGDPFDKAGAYGIQTVRDTFVKEIKGSYYNVMGLPIEDILQKMP